MNNLFNTIQTKEWYKEKVSCTIKDIDNKHKKLITELRNKKDNIIQLVTSGKTNKLDTENQYIRNLEKEIRNKQLTKIYLNYLPDFLPEYLELIKKKNDLHKQMVQLDKMQFFF